MNTTQTINLTRRAYTCRCGRPIFFDNSVCIACGAALGYDPGAGRLVPIEPGSIRNMWVTAQSRLAHFRLCQDSLNSGCNWLVPNEEPSGFCRACRLNRTIPNLDSELNRILWRKIESAKRRLVSSLLSSGLPVVAKSEDQDRGVAFDFLLPLPGAKPVLTGHEDGIITINLEEADDVVRERNRHQMGEPYRTLLGHLRHEIGHYYWDRLVAGQPAIKEFRQLFGDERLDYKVALQQYYAAGPLANWQASYVSAYATAHPWEDWAESWAHYLHMQDAVSAARSFGVTIAMSPMFERFDTTGLSQTPGAQEAAFLDLVNSWTPLATFSNELARSMGHADFYPFVLSRTSVTKLFFIHRVIESAARPQEIVQAANAYLGNVSE